MRYQSHHDRAYQRAAAELLKRQKERRLAEIGFASQKRAEAEQTRREQRQAQRDEVHVYRVAGAKVIYEREFLRTEQVRARLLSHSAAAAPAKNEPAAA